MPRLTYIESFTERLTCKVQWLFRLQAISVTTVSAAGDHFFAVAVMKFMALNTSDVVWDKSGLKPKKSVWVFQVWYYVVKHGLVTLVVITILQDTATFQVPFIVSVFCSWNIATVEINSSFTYMKVKSAKCLCVFWWSWSWSWSWSYKQLSGSCYFGLDLGFKQLVLFKLTSLLNTGEITNLP